MLYLRLNASWLYLGNPSHRRWNQKHAKSAEFLQLDLDEPCLGPEITIFGGMLL